MLISLNNSEQEQINGGCPCSCNVNNDEGYWSFVEIGEAEDPAACNMMCLNTFGTYWNHQSMCQVFFYSSYTPWLDQLSQVEQHI